MKVIFHIDIDAFYANCEVNKNPKLKDQPLVVSGISKRSVVTTASYAARAYGISSGMSLFEAKKLCSKLIIVPVNFELYDQVSEMFFDIIREFCPYLEVASIDECYLDVTNDIKNYQHPLDLAKAIQNAVGSKLNLTCSIGVATNKFLAKIASDLNKPNGITVIRNSEISTKLWPLAIHKMPGIGKKTAPLMIGNGIITIGDLIKREHAEYLRMVFKNQFLKIINQANGIDYSEINISNNLKSLSQSTTLVNDVNDETLIYLTLNELTRELVNRMMTNNKISNSLTLTVRYDDFTNHTRSVRLENYTSQFEVIYESMLLLFDQLASDRPIRHLGVGVNNLKDQSFNYTQPSLFDFTDEVTTSDLITTINLELNYPALTTLGSKYGQ
jgi:DNA polymerase IV